MNPMHERQLCGMAASASESWCIWQCVRGANSNKCLWSVSQWPGVHSCLPSFRFGSFSPERKWYFPCTPVILSQSMATTEKNDQKKLKNHINNKKNPTFPFTSAHTFKLNACDLKRWALWVQFSLYFHWFVCVLQTRLWVNWKWADNHLSCFSFCNNLCLLSGKLDVPILAF